MNLAKLFTKRIKVQENGAYLNGTRYRRYYRWMKREKKRKLKKEASDI